MGRPRVDTGLRFYHEVLGLDYFTYGLWEDEPVTLDGLQSAQQRYAERLLEWIPDGVRRVLDVGSGTGALSVLLRSRGYEVEGLSPDPFQRGLYEQRVGLPFHQTGFAEFRPDRPFDLALFSESAQYIRPPSALFDGVLRTSPGGYMLAADFFVVRHDPPASRSGHRLDAFLGAADDHGFVLEREEDVTAGVLPALDLARDFICQRVRPGIRIIEDYGKARRPYLYRLARRLVGKKLGRLDDMEIKLDREAFQRVKRYMFFLFKVPRG